jgi:hypothetical protein
MSVMLAFCDIERIAPKIGVTDAACPLCAAHHSPRGERKRVLRIWRTDKHFAGFHCARCGVGGSARDENIKSNRSSADRLAQIKTEAAQREAAERIERQRIALFLWSLRRPVENTPAEVYLRQARGYSGIIPKTLAYLQRKFIYSFTDQTGSGKTAVALLWSYSIAKGVPIGDREVQPGRVIYFAGENPDDVRQRWIAMAEHIGFDVDTIDVNFVVGVISLKDLENAIRQEIEATGPATAVVIDTSAAYFLGEDENNNAAMGNYARQLRRLTNLPGGPSVLVNCHPVKNASPDNLLPRGGGAYLCEMDGNLTCSATETVVSIHWQGKFRGSDFASLTFETRNVTAKKLKDKRGRQIITVYAAQLSDHEASERNSQNREQEDAVLVFMLNTEAAPSVSAIAEHLGFKDRNGKPLKSKAHRILKELKKHRLVTNERGESYALNEKGKEVAKKAAYNQKAKDASYG